MKKRFIVLLVLFLALASQQVWAGCCQMDANDPSPNYFYCRDSTESIPGSLLVTQVSCENTYDGIWTEDQCSDLNQCTDVCCCHDAQTGALEVDQYICDIYGGTSFQTWTGSCASHCEEFAQGNLPEYYDIFGFVKTTTGVVVAGAEVIIYEQGNVVERYPSTGVDGAYALQAQAGTYQLRALTDTCEGTLNIQVTDTALTHQNITLTDCDVTPGITDCVVPVWDCDWDSTDNQGRPCGYPDNCVNINPPGVNEIACLSPRAPDQTPVIPVQCVASNCGNDYVEGEEECEPGQTITDTCESLNLGIGDPTCNSYCRFDTAGCSVCPLTDPGSCTEEQCLSDCDSCIDNGYCTRYLDCSSFTVTLNDPQAVAESHLVDLTWVHEGVTCLRNVTRAHVQRCKLGTNGKCFSSSITNITVERPAQGFTVAYQWRDTEGIEPSALVSPRDVYQYKVFVVVDTGATPELVVHSLPKTLSAGDATCMEEHSPELCSDISEVASNGITGPYFRSYCDTDNILTLLDTQHSVEADQGPFDCALDEFDNERPCLGPFDSLGGTTTCGDATLCDYCNGVFAMYSYLGDLIVPHVAEETTFEACKDVYALQCFEQKTITVRNKLDQCGTVNSCYDYYTEDGCSANPCDIDGMNCQWRNVSREANDLIGAELGLGVCVPLSVADQDCTRCNEDTQLSPSCTADICQTYGNSCRLVEELSSVALPPEFVGQCRDTQELGCSIYTTQEDCDGGQPVNVNVQYDGVGQRISGTHAISPRSDDTNNFGLCQWIPEKSYCVRNADNTLEGNYEDDCHASGNRNTDCLGDNITPQTTFIARELRYGLLPVYGVKEKAFAFNVEDNAYKHGDLKSYYSLTPRSGTNFFVAMTKIPSDEIVGQETIFTTGTAACQAYGGTCRRQFCSACGDGEWACYTTTSNFCDGPLVPEIITQGITLVGGSSTILEQAQYQVDHCAWQVACVPPVQANYPTQTLPGLYGGDYVSAEYRLNYYSEDKARNLEPVRESLITLDATAPALRAYQEGIASYELDEEVWLSNIDLSYEVFEEHDYAQCKANLSSFATTTTISGDLEAVGRAFTQHYNYLPDGIYTWTLNCSDVFDNQVRYQKRMILDGDKSITNVTPQYKVYNTTSIDISLDTGNEALCRYSDTNYRPMEQGGTAFSSLDFFKHTSTVEVPYANRIYVYYTGCDFPDTHERTDGNPGDIILFSVDKSPPVTTVIDSFTGQEYAPLTWLTKQELELECVDSHPDLEYEQEGITISLNAGKDHIEYYLSNDQGVRCGATRVYDGTKIVVTNQTVENCGGFLTLNYACVDKGLNREAWKQQEIKVKDTRFNRPRVRICDPAGTAENMLCTS